MAVAGGQPAPLAARLRIGLSGDAVQFLPLYLGGEQHLFRREGLEVAVVNFGGGARAAAALAGGSIDIVATSLESILAAIRGGHPVKVFYSPSGGIPFKWYARPEIAGWADLRGRRAAVSSFGSVSDVLTRYALRRHGLVAGTDVYVVQAGEPAVRLAALRAGRVDAAILFTPRRLRGSGASAARAPRLVIPGRCRSWLRGKACSPSRSRRFEPSSGPTSEA
jgi:NitT/TauT family transport system substrate-binding protein